MSPKCHPEIAGCAIEYAWGYSKQKFRRVHNDYVACHLHDNVMKSFLTTKKVMVNGLEVEEKLLNVQLCMKYARKTRDFCRVYEQMAEQKQLNENENLTEEQALVACGGVDMETQAYINKMLKEQKCHRNIYDLYTNTRCNNTDNDVDS